MCLCLVVFFTNFEIYIRTDKKMESELLKIAQKYNVEINFRIRPNQLHHLLRTLLN